MKNQVIKVLNPEHGKQIIAYWKSKGIHTRGLTGSIDNNCISVYYGIINDIFDCYFEANIRMHNVEIITLPLQLPEYGEEILVWDYNESAAIKRRFSSLGHHNEAFPVFVISEPTGDGKHTTHNYRNWKPLPKEQIVELTIQDISNGKGVGVPPHLIRIKK